ncbi:R3H and coiled-coil domain-containing protein 1 [Gadus macrocephalus]|uniref:R3H and coiled-coil domain-containing protein 1 n=1 Tax=Gadus macrocephalus TaxID=80720 RepID=UPI0028CB6F91|nr:R3H and coiled-coil domain-containing protein 1 [Gadus macrocephalus]
MITTLAFPSFDGCYLPKQESVFVHLLLDELDGYIQRLDRKNVLVFPPLPSRLRFLIHKTTESHSELATFSVGEDWSRRVVVCFSEQRCYVDDACDPENNPSCSVGEAALTPRNRGHMDKAHVNPPPSRRRTRASKRPDRALYTPQAARQRSSFPQDPPAQGRAPEPASLSSCSTTSESKLLTDKPMVMPSHVSSMPHDGTHGGDFNSPLKNLETALPEADHLTWSFSLEQTMSDFTGMKLDQGRCGGKPKLEEEAEGGDKEERGTEMASPCDANLTEDIKTLITKLTDEISAGLKETDGVVLEYAHNDYSPFETVLMNTTEFGHVIEIYGFPAVFKTDDLIDAFTDYSAGGMKITWVDDTHALAIFSSETAAHHALSINHPLLKTRTLSQASQQSKAKAGQRAEFIQPVKERPKTDSAVARRMVTRALGIQTGRVKRY